MSIPSESIQGWTHTYPNIVGPSPVDANAAKAKRAIGSPLSAPVQTSASVPPTKLTAVDPAIPLQVSVSQLSGDFGRKTDERNRVTRMVVMF